MSADLNDFVLGAAFNLVTAIIAVRFIYYPRTQKRNYVFTFLAFNPTIYFVMALLASAELSVGVGFGLFAIFSVIRYRTEEMPIREMTYLFVIIALPVMNAIFANGGAMEKVLIANGVTLALLYLLERGWGFDFEASTHITYERVDLIVPGRRADLIADLRERTGLPVTRVDIGRINFLHDSAELTVYYQPLDGPRQAAMAGHARAAQLIEHEAR